MDSSQAIGIFDSGIGGLTVARAIHELLPNERIIYFGDTAHFPYGDKSSTALQAYAIKVCNALLQQNCKVILIACNSASAAAYELVKAYVGSKATVINVIDPVVEYIAKNHKEECVGLIGTKQTVLSNVYKTKVDEKAVGINLQSLATPLLAPMIEEGFFSNKISKSIIENYLQDETLNLIDSLILGCTHYPLIKNEIDAYYNKEVDIIDSSYVVAKHVEKLLLEKNLLALKKQEDHHFYVSDFTISFQQSTALFFGKEVQLELYKIWD